MQVPQTVSGKNLDLFGLFKILDSLDEGLRVIDVGVVADDEELNRKYGLVEFDGSISRKVLKFGEGDIRLLEVEKAKCCKGLEEKSEKKDFLQLH